MKATPEAQDTDVVAQTRRSVPHWQRVGSRRTLWRGLAAVFAASLLGIVLHRWAGADRDTALVVPWMLAFIMFVPGAYHRGVRDARAHAADITQ
jgi:hypothetical protein